MTSPRVTKSRVGFISARMPLAVLGSMLMSLSVSVTANDLPEPGGAYGPVFLFGPVPMYDMGNIPEPGGSFGIRNQGSQGGRIEDRQIDSARQEADEEQLRRRRAAADAARSKNAAASDFKSNLSMIRNYASSGLCEKAVDHLRKCLAVVDDSTTAEDLYAVVYAMAKCQSDASAREMQLRVCRMIIERFPESQEAQLAGFELGG